MADFLTAVTPLILTYNEAPNLPRVLERLDWARRIVVLDSGSTDATEAIARAHPAVDFRVRCFDNHAAQWTHGLESCGIDTEWVLALDADYVLGEDLVAELSDLQPASDVVGYELRFRWAVHGRLLSGTLYPPVVALYRRAGANYVQTGHTQRVRLQGRIEALRHPAIHDDRKPLARWLASQDRYAALEAAELLDAPWNALRWQAKVRRLMFVAPWLVPLYCLTVRRGLLDGKAGWHYALQRGIAEAIIALKLIERRLGIGPPG